MNYTHSGDLGDIIFALPAIRATGGGELYLFPTPGKTTVQMTSERAAVIAPLLLRQSYISKVICVDKLPSGVIDHAINGFRNWCRRGNLADAHLATVGLDYLPRCSQWLEVSPRNELDIVVNWTGRYRNLNFPWKRIMNYYHGRVTFLGLPDEHKAFCDLYGHCPYRPTADLLEAAELLAGCTLPVCCPSVLQAICEGLKRSLVAEVYCGLTVFERMGRINGWTADIELPAV